MKVVRITPKNRGEYSERIAALEAIATYPLGADSFKINHGDDYFAFFDRMGEVVYHAMVDEGRVVGVGCGILREKPMRTWYLCDLKVHPEYRGGHIPLTMLSSAFLRNYLRCRKGYAISMDPANGRPNRMARLVEHFRWIPIRAAGKLELFSLDEAAMRACAPLVERHRGPLSYLSMAGKKDIVLQSSGKPMPLRHVQFGPCAEQGDPEPVPGCVHMLCTPALDPLAAALRAQGLEPGATATIIQHGMDDVRWDFVLTSEI